MKMRRSRRSWAVCTASNSGAEPAAWLGLNCARRSWLWASLTSRVTSCWSETAARGPTCGAARRGRCMRRAGSYLWRD